MLQNQNLKVLYANILQFSIPELAVSISHWIHSFIATPLELCGTVRFVKNFHLSKPITWPGGMGYPELPKIVRYNFKRNRKSMVSLRLGVNFCESVPWKQLEEIKI